MDRMWGCTLESALLCWVATTAVAPSPVTMVVASRNRLTGPAMRERAEEAAEAEAEEEAEEEAPDRTV